MGEGDSSMLTFVFGRSLTLGDLLFAFKKKSYFSFLLVHLLPGLCCYCVQ